MVLTSQTDRKSEDDANSMNSSNKHVSIKEDHLWVVAAVVMVHRWRSRRRLSNQQLASTVHGCRAYVDIWRDTRRLLSVRLSTTYLAVVELVEILKGSRIMWPPPLIPLILLPWFQEGCVCSFSFSMYCIPTCPIFHVQKDLYKSNLLLEEVFTEWKRFYHDSEP